MPSSLARLDGRDARAAARRGAPARPRLRLARLPGVPADCPRSAALIRDIEAEHRARDEEQFTWTPDSLRAILHGELRGEDVIVVSNREPYIHQRRGDRIEVQRPASGLVTALEPIMRACSGTWIAHGSGSADREVVDATTRRGAAGGAGLQLRRVWLTRGGRSRLLLRLRQRGPVAALPHRPRAADVPLGDWEQYVAVNRKFAEAVVRRPRPTIPSSWFRTTTSRCCRG